MIFHCENKDKDSPFLFATRTCQMKVRKSSVDSVFLAVIYLNYDVFGSHSLWDSLGLQELNTLQMFFAKNVNFA